MNGLHRSGFIVERRGLALSKPANRKRIRPPPKAFAQRSWRFPRADSRAPAGFWAVWPKRSLRGSARSKLATGGLVFQSERQIKFLDSGAKTVLFQMPGGVSQYLKADHEAAIAGLHLPAGILVVR